MVIEVLYKSFRYEKFDSSAQTNSEPFRAKGTNILTDWNLYLGALEENGITSQSTGMTEIRARRRQVTLEAPRFPPPPVRSGAPCSSSRQMSWTMWSGSRRTAKSSCGGRAMS